MICPLQSVECNKNCAWWCAGEKECAIKVLVLQLIKMEEKK